MSANNNMPRPDSISFAENEVKIYDMPVKVRKHLCGHLDELNVWLQLAEEMHLSPSDVQSIKSKQLNGDSPSNALLLIWGHNYDHSVTELFILLHRLKLFPAMRILRQLVSRKHQMRIPPSTPAFSKIMENTHSHHNDHQISEKQDSTTSGVSNSNTTTDNNNWRSRSQLHSNQNEYSLINDSSVQKYASCLLEINYSELGIATNNWDKRCILGKGGFGTVFRGYWKHTEVAIKQIHYCGADGRENIKIQIQQSLNELKYLNACRHDNILPLYGFSIKGEKPCLVYQLMKGGSLEQRLNPKNLTSISPLTWEQRIAICLGSARGINFLHTFRNKPLIHGDIKPANVLLDQCLQPKIGDFGLAREGPNDIKSVVEVTQVFGTRPYLPPEFLNSRKLSTKVDTYSFGVVLLEVFTGMRVYDNNRPQPLLTKHIMSQSCKMEELLDKRVPLLPGQEEICKRSIELSLKCIAKNPQDRPEMEENKFNFAFENL
uniref:non-specific serine/threonine protein kinase n=1 Tax=Glossina brevipalpis TaxID=37001 RepID=A0A1A9WJS4_9MUSC